MVQDMYSMPHVESLDDPKAKDYLGKWGRKIGRTEVVEDQRDTLSSGHNRKTTAHMNSQQQPWLPVQELYKIKAINVPTWSREGFMSFRSDRERARQIPP